jgi:hypothetical protein
VFGRGRVAKGGVERQVTSFFVEVEQRARRLKVVVVRGGGRGYGNGRRRGKRRARAL